MVVLSARMDLEREIQKKKVQRANVVQEVSRRVRISVRFTITMQC